MGLLGGETVHQCWGRDLLNLPEGDKGFGVIKPSGSEQNVAIVSGNRILVRPKDGDVRVYDYQLGGDAKAVITRKCRTRPSCRRSWSRSSRPRPRACWRIPRAWYTGSRTRTDP